MEALAAIGLAGNIVQFIDFTCKLLDQATSIYLSHTGSLGTDRDIETIARSLQELSARISQGRQSQN